MRIQIPEISDEDLKFLELKIRVVHEFRGHKGLCEYPTKSRNLYYVERSDSRSNFFLKLPTPSEPATDLVQKPYKTIETLHLGFGSKFRASLAEVFAQVPIVDRERCVALRISPRPYHPGKRDHMAHVYLYERMK